jgi:PPOX class probable F420-dependent enzyme
MGIDIDARTLEFILNHRVARLATAGVDRQPAVIPICYVFDDGLIYTPIDEKPKSVAAGSLKRVRNIRVNSKVALVIDDYSEEWNRLVHVLISGDAEILSAGGDDPSEHTRAVELLREKYPQYRSMKLGERPIIKITPARIKRWAPGENNPGS